MSSILAGHPIASESRLSFSLASSLALLSYHSHSLTQNQRWHWCSPLGSSPFCYISSCWWSSCLCWLKEVSPTNELYFRLAEIKARPIRMGSSRESIALLYWEISKFCFWIFNCLKYDPSSTSFSLTHSTLDEVKAHTPIPSLNFSISPSTFLSFFSVPTLLLHLQLILIQSQIW